MENEFETKDAIVDSEELESAEEQVEESVNEDANVKETKDDGNILQKIYFISLICGIVIGVIFTFIGIGGALSKNATEYDGYTYSTQEAKFGADYYTYSYEAQRAAVSATNQVTIGMRYATKSLAMAK